MTPVYPEEVESAFRTIAGAAPNLRRRVFEMMAPDAFSYAQIAGIEKIEIVDRLENLGVEFGWPAEERQRLISAAAEQAERPGRSPVHPIVGEPTEDEIIRPPEFSDEALALLFAECYADGLRYVYALGKWFVWDSARWHFDETLVARDRVRKTCRAVAARCGEKQDRIAKAIASAKTVAGVERLAQSDRRLAAVVDQFDRDIFLFNTPGGVVDLRTGLVTAHNPSLYLTKIAGVAPDFEMPTPVWQAFLHRIMAGHDDVIAYLQRVCGYALTGSTQEHALWFFFGAGANGKSTFLNAITAAAGDYHRTAPIETFTSSSHDRHPTDLAGLRGARLVTSVETEEGRRWAESRLKSLTGGDKIAARFMRQDFFEFTPQFKLMIAGNHKPGLRSVDEAMRRRVNLVPFEVTIPPAERDETLSEKLKGELPGILAWMIKGCADWMAHGLSAPKIVTDATAAYLESEDAIAAWLDDMASRASGSFTKVADLFASWSAWAEKAGEYVGSAKRFSQALEARGFTPHRHAQLGRGFLGIRLADYADMAPQKGDGP